MPLRGCVSGGAQPLLERRQKDRCAFAPRRVRALVSVCFVALLPQVPGIELVGTVPSSRTVYLPGDSFRTLQLTFDRPVKPTGAGIKVVGSVGAAGVEVVGAHERI